MKKLLILDANSIVNRAFYAVRPLTTKDGFHTNAIFGFLNILTKYTEEIAPDYIAAAFDLPKPTFRHKMFDGYKATRHKMPEELAEQIPMLKDVLSAMNIKIFEKEGFEADDIIGTASRICEEEGVRCCVLTGDRDDLQLASEQVHIHLVTTRMGTTSTEVFDDKKVFEKYGVTPQEFIDLKAIMGDSSDNIPGVRGIGEKGALALITAFHSIDGVYENIESDTISKSVRTKLKDGKEDAYMSKTLATIDRHVPIAFDVSQTACQEADGARLYRLFEQLEFRSFIKKLGLNAPQETAEAQTDFWEGKTFQTITDVHKLQELLCADYVCWYFDKMADTIAFCTDDTHAYCAEFQAYNTIWKSFFESETKKCTHGLKEQILHFGSLGIELNNVAFDTEIGAYLLAPSKKDYETGTLAQEFLGIYTDDAQEEGEQLSLDSLLIPAADDMVPLMKKALLVRALKAYETEQMQNQGLMELFLTIEMPLVFVLASMEQSGVTVDKTRLVEFGNQLTENIQKLTEQIYELAGHAFNINSPKQLGVVLFEELALPVKKKTKSGYSTNAEVLEKLKPEHPIVEKILEYRKLSKLNSTYVDGLLAVICEKTGKIHSSFNQTVTVTGRISSTEPNLQNIPVRTQLGREMRKMFVASSPDFVLVDADYSQIELRVLAHLSGDENMIEAFASGFDIHAATAAKIFGVDKETVTGEMRSAAKAINFGLVYGMGEFSLSQDLHISVKEAKAYIEDYLGTYPKVRDFMKNAVESAKKSGYSQTLFGRKREIYELSSSNYQTRAFGERAAMNTPVQGTAADIIKLAMIRVYNRLKEEGLQSKLILQVHDELIIEAKKDETERVCTLLREEMEQAAKLLVPLKVDLKTGNSWYDTK